MLIPDVVMPVPDTPGAYWARFVTVTIGAAQVGNAAGNTTADARGGAIDTKGKWPADWFLRDSDSYGSDKDHIDG
jgi:hypothetical protein